MSECISAQFWCIIEKKTLNKVTSSSPQKMFIHKQEVTFLLLPVWQEMVPLLLANMKAHYYSFKMSIKIKIMCQKCIW